MEQYYKIAGLTVMMDSFGRAAAQARPYEIDPAEPDLILKADRKAIQRRYPGMPEDECEYSATCVAFYQSLLDFDGLMLHASAVVMDGRAYLFTAMPGTGKSTHTALWRRAFGDERARILNDDKPALRWEDGQFFAYGTPWSGKSDLNLNLRVPLGGVCLLSRGEENVIEPFTGSGALFTLLEQTVRPADAAGRRKLMNLLEKLLATVPVWKMRCNMETQAAWVSYRAMSGCGKEETT